MNLSSHLSLSFSIGIIFFRFIWAGNEQLRQYSYKKQIVIRALPTINKNTNFGTTCRCSNAGPQNGKSFVTSLNLMEMAQELVGKVLPDISSADNIMQVLSQCDNDYISECEDSAYGMTKGISQRLIIGKSNPTDQSSMTCNDHDTPDIEEVSNISEVPSEDILKDDLTQKSHFQYPCLGVISDEGWVSNKPFTDSHMGLYRRNNYLLIDGPRINLNDLPEDKKDAAWWLRKCCAQRAMFREPTEEYKLEGRLWLAQYYYNKVYYSWNESHGPGINFRMSRACKPCYIPISEENRRKIAFRALELSENLEKDALLATKIGARRQKVMDLEAERDKKELQGQKRVAFNKKYVFPARKSLSKALEALERVEEFYRKGEEGHEDYFLVMRFRDVCATLTKADESHVLLNEANRNLRFARQQFARKTYDAALAQTNNADNTEELLEKARIEGNIVAVGELTVTAREAKTRRILEELNVSNKVEDKRKADVEVSKLRLAKEEAEAAGTGVEEANNQLEAALQNANEAGQKLNEARAKLVTAQENEDKATEAEEDKKKETGTDGEDEAAEKDMDEEEDTGIEVKIDHCFPF